VDILGSQRQNFRPASRTVSAIAMNQRTVMSLAAVVALTGALASGCGGGGDGLSKSDYIKQADAICAKDSKKLNAASRKFGSKPTQRQLNHYVTANFVPTIEDQIKELRRLEAPNSDQAKLTKIYDEVDRGLRKLKTQPQLLTKGNPFKKANQGAQAYGLKVCGS
jgi:hypothetical protein